MGWGFLFAEGGRGAYGQGAGEGCMGGSADGGRYLPGISHFQQTALSIMNEIIYFSELNGH